MRNVKKNCRNRCENEINRIFAALSKRKAVSFSEVHTENAYRTPHFIMI